MRIYIPTGGVSRIRRKGFSTSTSTGDVSGREPDSRTCAFMTLGTAGRRGLWRSARTCRSSPDFSATRSSRPPPNTHISRATPCTSLRPESPQALRRSFLQKSDARPQSARAGIAAALRSCRCMGSMSASPPRFETRRSCGCEPSRSPLEPLLKCRAHDRSLQSNNAHCPEHLLCGAIAAIIFTLVRTHTEYAA